VTGVRIAVLRATFKPGTDDTRNFPALTVADHLHAAGAEVLIYDPQAHLPTRDNFTQVATVEDAITGAEIATDNPSQVRDVGSTTAITPGVSASRAVNDRRPANVGATRNRSIRTRPSASIPTRTSRGGSLQLANRHEGSPFA
jgi:UDP-N-acetyl-D-mannosaminuronate dehydrogenase